MRRIGYLVIFVVLFLILKAFFLDDYLAEYKRGDANVSAEANGTTEVTQAASEPKPAHQENNVSTKKPEKEPVAEEKKMPLEQLGDTLTKHIKL